MILEATNRCNLDCSICLRQSWDGQLGDMPAEVFQNAITGLQEFPSPPEVFFGGYGEPLSHPYILDMVRQSASAGCQTALITNGTLLTPHLVESLVDAGLSRLWISVDSAHHSAGENSRPGEFSGSMLDRLARIQTQANGLLDALHPGLAFVLTRQNQDELRDVLDQSLKLGFKRFFISNLEAYAASQAAELPYNLDTLRHPGTGKGVNSKLTQILARYERRHPGIEFSGTWKSSRAICPFADRGDLVCRWDGEISPCLPLLYSRTTYIASWEHKQYPHSLGNIRQRSLREIWEDSEYSSLRQRLLQKAFSPCLGCRDCYLSEDNLLDCMGYPHPTCGGCLWAAGLVSCP